MGAGLATREALAILASLGQGPHVWPCLAAGVCRDDGTKIGFGIGCAGAHVSRGFHGEPALKEGYKS